METDIRKLQIHLLEMLKWFHCFCNENHLRYYALGGTMLGAVRHKGFIPWDDDIDVGMPRPDYEKLIQLIGDRECEGYYLETPYSGADEYRYPYSKLYDTGTTLTENTWPALKRGVFIDVFPLDGMGQSEAEGCKRWRSINRMADLIWTRTCAVNKRRAVYKNIAIIFAHMIPDVLFRNKAMLKRIQEECKYIGYADSAVIGNTFGNWGAKEIMPEAVMGKPKLYQFEDTEIFGAEQAGQYLTRLYGAWQELPPAEKRITHHDYLELDLEKPYR